MTRRLIVLIFIAALGIGASLSRPGQADTEYTFSSPNNAIEVRISAGAALTYAIRHRGGELIAPSAVSMSLEDGRILNHEDVHGGCSPSHYFRRAVAAQLKFF